MPCLSYMAQELDFLTFVRWFFLHFRHTLISCQNNANLWRQLRERLYSQIMQKYVEENIFSFAL